MNGHDYGLTAVFDFQEQRRQFQSTASLSRSNFAELFNVRPGHEGLATPDEHRRLDGIVFVDLLNRRGNALWHARA